jgi:hypothetical protein
MRPSGITGALRIMVDTFLRVLARMRQLSLLHAGHKP